VTSVGRVCRRASAAGFVGAFLLYWSGAALAYRTAQDGALLPDAGRVAWAAPEVPFSLHAEDLPSGVSAAEVEAAVILALQAWSEPECSSARPSLSGWSNDAPAPGDGINSVAWVRDWSKRGFPASAPGNTDLSYRGSEGNWEIAEADIYLNAADFDWSTSSEPTDVQTVVTHELGHALGLLHPCEPDGDGGAPVCGAEPPSPVETMYPFYSEEQASLSDDDIAGICYLYPEGCGSCEGEQVCMEGECRSPCSDVFCAKGEVFGYWGCVAQSGCRERDCAGAACDSDSACAPLGRCVSGVCIRGGAAWGEACSKTPDCADGACVSGTCQPDCRAEAGCGLAGSCELAEDEVARGCVGSGRYPDGFTCRVGEDCSSGLCVFTDAVGACTKACSGPNDCSGEWACENVEGAHVCVPPGFNLRGGCSFGRAPGTHAWLAAALAAAMWVRRRQRQDTARCGAVRRLG
jgi:hypothetical protein